MKTEARQSGKGFTLVELVLAMVIMGLLMTSIFKLADATVLTTRAMVDHQSEEITREAFFTLMKRHFESLPGNCVVNLLPTSETEPYLSELTFQNAPTSFNWGGVPMSAEAIRIVTVPSLEGLNIVLEYFDEPILDSEETVAERGIEPIASVVLLEGVSDFVWTVLDGRNLNVEREEWPYEWDSNSRKPTFIELTASFSGSDEVIRRMFWCPTRVSPRTKMQQLVNAARANAQGPSGGGGGQGGGGGGRGGGGRGEGGRGEGGRGEGGRGGGGEGGRGGRTEGATGSAPARSAPSVSPGTGGGR